MAPLQHPRGRTPELCPSLWQRSAAGPPKTPILGPFGALSPKVSLKNEFSLGTHRADRVPTWPLYNTHGLPPLNFDPFLGYTGVIPLLHHSQNDPPPPDSCTHSLPKKRVFPGYPPTQQGTHMAPLQHPWGRTPELCPSLWQRSAAGPPKTPILGPFGALSPKVSLKNEFSLGTHRADRVPTWPLYNTHGLSPLNFDPFLGYTGVIPLLHHSQNDPPPPDSCTHSLPKKRVFPGYPPTQQGTHMAPLQHPRGRTPELCPSLWQRSAAGPPKTPILGPFGALSPKVSLKNEFSLGTHRADRVPTWPLYNTHGLPPLNFDPFLGYTGVIPLLQHSQNDPPPPDSCTHSLPKKRVFPGYPPTQQDTHMAPLQHPRGRTPELCPSLWQRSAAGPPKTPILGPFGALSPKVSLKNEFSLGTHRADRVPTWPLNNTHGLPPLNFDPFLGYTGVIPLLHHSQNDPPPPDTCTHSLPKKRVFPGYPPSQQGTHMAPLQHPRGRTPELCPSLWQRSAAGPPKTPILGPFGALSPKVSLKNEFSLGTHRADRVPTWPLYNTHGLPPLNFDPFLGYTGVIPLLHHSQNDPPPPRLLYPQSP